MKTCSKCGIQKSLSEFYQRSEDNSKYMALCKPCANTRTRNNYSKSKTTKMGHAYLIFNKRKRQAKYEGIPFTVTFEDMWNIVGDNCDIFNTPLGWGVSTNKPCDNSPSLDKIIPELGYIPGNVRWVSYRANSLKNNGNEQEFKAIIKYLEKYGEEKS